MGIGRDLLDKLACPRCKAPVRLLDDEAGLACDACSLLYPIEQGIPVMIVEEARPLDRAE